MSPRRLVEASVQDHIGYNKRRRLVRKRELVWQSNSISSSPKRYGKIAGALVELSTFSSLASRPTLSQSVPVGIAIPRPNSGVATPPSSSSSGSASVVGASAVRGTRRTLVDEEEGEDLAQPAGSAQPDSPCPMNGEQPAKRARTEAEDEQAKMRGGGTVGVQTMHEESCMVGEPGGSASVPAGETEQTETQSSLASEVPRAVPAEPIHQEASQTTSSGGPSPPSLKRKLERVLTGGEAGRSMGRQKRQKVAGFLNPQYRCFINASVQCLASLPEVREYCASKMGAESPVSWSGNISPSEGVSTPSIEGRRSRRNEDGHSAKIRRALEKVEPENIDLSYEFGNLVNDLCYEPGSQTTPPLLKPVEKKMSAKKVPTIDGEGFAASFGRLYDGFDGELQQDAMEFVTQLLTRMRQEEIAHNRAPFIEETFEGEMLHSMHCSNCEGTWDNKETFRDIGVNFTEEAVRNSSVRPTRLKPAVQVSLDSCLDEAFRKQPMDVGTKCRMCGVAGGVSDTPAMLSLPNNVIMQIKRFSTRWVSKKTRAGSRLEMVNGKVFASLIYGETLNFQKYFTRSEGRPSSYDQTFELTAMVVHKGLKPTQGHYLAYAQRERQWYFLDDVKCVKPVSFKEVLDNAAPYLMFWKRKERPNSPISL